MAESSDLAAILRDLLSEKGQGLLARRADLQAALRDKAPGEGRDIHLLLTALDAGVPERLRGGDGAPDPAEIGQETNLLVDQFGVAPDFARRAVDVWAMALGRLAGAAPEAKAPAPSPVAAAALPPLPGAREPAEAGSPESPSAGGLLPGLPPLPSAEGMTHEASVLAEAGPTTGPAVQVNPLPPPPELPVPSPASTGPVKAGGNGTVSPETGLPPVQPLPPVRPLPAAQALPGVQPLPGAAPLPGVKPLPGVQPLPGGAGMPGVQPLPGVKPLPGAGGPPPVQPLPGVAGASAQRPFWLRLALGGVGAVLVAFGLLALIGVFTDDGKKTDPTPGPTPTSDPKPDPKSDPKPPGPTAAGGTTAEGFPIVDAQTQPNIPAKRLDNDPNSLLFTFGLRSGQETYTYQAAVDFSGGDKNGRGLITVFKNGKEARTDVLTLTRAVEGNGYLGFTMSGPLKGEVSAPAICVSALAGKSSDRFDLTNGGGLFCAFGTKQNGLCDGDVKIGCGNLVP